MLAMRMRRAWRAIKKKWPWSLPVHLKLDVLGFAIPSGLSHASTIFSEARCQVAWCKKRRSSI